MRAELSVYRDYVRRERELAQKEAANNDKAIELAKQEADLVRKELELEKQRSEFYRAAYEALKGGRSKKCIFLKVITLTLFPCK